MSPNDFIMNHELAIRLSFFFGVFILIALWEIMKPKRPLLVSKTVRWINNLGLVILNSILLRLLFPAAAVGAAITAKDHSWGLFNNIDIPFFWSVLFAVIILDFIIYLQHVMVHSLPVLWRLHRVHHADVDYDVTTGARFHPLEIILSMLIKFATIFLLGPPVIAVVIFEILLNAIAMFNHGNIHLPEKVDAFLRLFVVTPDMHRVHHSIEDDETNSNFGFNIPWWDRIFGTYREQPRAGHKEMIIGIHDYKELKQVAWITGMLTLPFTGKITSYAINRRTWEQKDKA